VLAGPVYGQVPASNDTSDGNFNTGMGTGALGGPAASNSGLDNTATGYQALFNSTGDYNTAAGRWALYANGAGNDNTALGAFALEGDGGPGDVSSYNTAVGANALRFNQTGGNNTAIGVYTLQVNQTGSNNTASGYGALNTNETGNDNTATGYDALYMSTSGYNNTAAGTQALYSDTTGNRNVATGYDALYSNTTGIENTAAGASALYASTTGSNNVAMGFHAGYDLTTGSNNIDIGNIGAAADGVAADSGVIRIGTLTPKQLQKSVFIAGIYNTPVAGNAVMVDSSGQLGVVVSSERFKTGIAPMGSNSAKLNQLRPVTFKLKSDAKGTVQYGLIAEEVAKVYPELVIRDENGGIDGVRYDELAPMLLNEIQKEHATVATLVAQHEADATKIAVLEQKVAEVDDLKQQLSAVIQELKARDNLVAQR